MGRSIYAYTGGNPISRTDPLGLWWFGDALPQSFVNAAAGIGDAFLFDQGARLRRMLGVDGGIDTCSRSYRGGEAAGIVGTFLTGEGEAQVAERLLTSEGTLRVTETVAAQLAGERSFIPVQSILDTVASGTRIPDPQGVANYFMYSAEAGYNGSVGRLEVLVDEASNTIAHVLYRSAP